MVLARQRKKTRTYFQKFDPFAEQVDLFEAVDAGQVTVRLIPKNAMGGNVLIENKTDKPLTVSTQSVSNTESPSLVQTASTHSPQFPKSVATQCFINY